MVSQRLYCVKADLRATNIDSCKYITAQIAKCSLYHEINLYLQNGGSGEVPFTRHTFTWPWFQLISYAPVFGIPFLRF